jgi:hypothetical protein
LDLSAANLLTPTPKNWLSQLPSEIYWCIGTRALTWIANWRGWFKPKSVHDYYWFTDDEHKQAQLQKFTQAPRKWFWRSEKEVAKTEAATTPLDNQSDNSGNNSSSLNH